jgi:hypothetical protein
MTTPKRYEEMAAERHRDPMLDESCTACGELLNHCGCEGRGCFCEYCAARGLPYRTLAPLEVAWGVGQLEAPFPPERDL